VGNRLFISNHIYTMSASVATARRLKTAIAAETGNIQGMAERFIAESDDYLVRRIPAGSYDPSQGEDPIKIRYSTAPIEDQEYIDILTTGSVDEDMTARGCNGSNQPFDVSVNRRGAPGCNLAGQTIHGGYDVFTRVVKGKAWETEVICALDLIQKKHYQAYISMLQRDLPARAVEQFQYSLERNVIEVGHYNTSVVPGFTFSQGEFPAVPVGTLDLATVRRVFTIMEKQGWKGTREITTSVEAFQTMRLNYKKNHDVEFNSSLDSGVTHFLPDGTETVTWAGIKWVLLKHPPRGYLVSTLNGLKFVPVRPTIARAGTGEGVVTDINEDYFNCYTYCDGQRHELYEIGFYVHETAANRQAFAVPQVGPKSFSKGLFNFEVDMIDGAFLDCNKDNLKFHFRLRHAYAFESTMPELMGAIIYRVQPDIIYINEPVCDNGPCDGDPITPQAPNPQFTSDCIQDDLETEALAFRAARLPEPTQAAPSPAPAAGFLIQRNTAITCQVNCGTVRVEVERIGGVDGAASATLATANTGTLTGAGSADFVSESDTLNWADGEAGVKYIDITIQPAASPIPGTINVVLSGATGAAIAGTATAVVTVVEAPDCEVVP
jgi:hypothetical protein